MLTKNENMKESLSDSSNVKKCFSLLLLDVGSKAFAGKFREAEDVVHNSLRSDLGLDTVAYNTFIKAMLEAGLCLPLNKLFNQPKKGRTNDM